MEKVINSFKNLYKGEEIAAKHWSLISLFILPAILSGAASLMDKDTPSQVMIIVGIAVLALFALSIVPFIWLLGYSIRFAEDRMMDRTGIPKIDLNMLWEGVKVLPLTIVWGIYFAIVFIVIMALPFLPLIGSNGDTSSIIIAILGFFVALMVVFAFCVLVVPFYNYIIIEYIKYGLQGYLFNPLTLVNFMKAAFKDTVIVFAKFWAVAIVASIPIGILNIVIFIVAFGALAISAVGAPSDSDAAIYNPLTISIIIILGTLMAILQMYVNTMIANAATENYVEVYKTEIEVLENNEEFDIKQDI